MSLRTRILYLVGMIALSFNSVADQKQPIPVGVVLPLTGEQADLGKAVLNGVELGMFQSSAPITLYPYDTKSTMDGTVTAVEDAVGHRMPFVIGPMSSAETSTIHAVTAGKSTLILSLSNDHTAITPQVFLQGLTAPLQTKRIIEFARGKGVNTIIGIFRDTPQGHQWAEAFKEYGQVFFYNPEDKESKEVKAIGDYINKMDPGGIFIPEAGNATLSLIANLRYQDANPAKRQLLGSMGWDQPVMIKDQNLTKAWFVTYDWPAWQKFQDAYKSHFGAEPPKLAFLGYQAIGKIEQHMGGKHIWDQPYRVSVMEIRSGHLKHVG
jgi:branched-chain amino acid transport system substrate-binding protein